MIDQKQPAKISNLVTILIEDAMLLQGWFQFCKKLGSEAQYIERWDLGIRNRTLSYQIFFEILTCWVSRNCDKTVGDLCEVLEDLKFEVTAEKLKTNFDVDDYIRDNASDETEFLPQTGPKLDPDGFVSTLKKNKWPVYFCPKATSNFSGRTTELEKMKKFFKGKREKENIIMIHGAAGIGKSETCKKFANEIKASVESIIKKVKEKNSKATVSAIKTFTKETMKGEGTSCLWLRGETSETLRNSLFQVALSMGYLFQSEFSFKNYLDHLVQLFLDNSSRLIIIIDNVSSISTEVTKIIDMAKPNVKIFLVMTSRNKLVTDNIATLMPLTNLSDEVAKNMLKQSSMIFKDKEANLIFSTVKNFPSALQQVISYMKEQQSKFDHVHCEEEDYVKKFNNIKFELKDQSFESEYAKTIYVTSNIIIRKLEEPTKKLLNILAHLQPDTIHLKFLEEICKDHIKNRLVASDLETICRYSLASNVTKDVVSMHKLDQEVIRHHYNTKDNAKALFDTALLAAFKLRENESSWIEMSIQSHLNYLADLAFPFEQKPKTFDNSVSVLDFLLHNQRFDCAIKFTNIILPNLKFDVDAAGQKELIEKVYLWNIVCGYGFVTRKHIEDGTFPTGYYNVDNYYLERSRLLAERIFGKNSQIVFQVKNKMIRVMYLEGKHLHGKNQLNEILSICREIINGILLVCPEYVEANFSNQLAEVSKTLNLIAKNLKARGRYIELNHVLALLEDLSEIQKYSDIAQPETPLAEAQRLNLTFKIESKLCEECDLELISKEEIEQQFGTLNYNQFELKILKKIIKFYNDRLGKTHELTIKAKNAKATKFLCKTELSPDDRVKWIKLCNKVLNSSFYGEYKVAFYNLLKAEGIQYNNFERQIKKLTDLQSSKENETSNSNILMKIKEMLAEVYEKAGNFESALNLFKQVRVFVAENSTNNHLLELHNSNVMRVKIRQGYFPYPTEDDIRREFSGFNEYQQLSLKELQNILPIFTRILGGKDQITLRVKNALAFKLYFKKQFDNSFLLFEQVLNSNNEIEVESAYNLIQSVNEHLDLSEDYEVARDWVQNALYSRIQLE